MQMLRNMFPEEMEEKLHIVIEEAKGEIDDAVERLLCPDHYEVQATYSKYFEAGPSSRPDDFEAGPSSRHDDFEAHQAPTLMKTVPCAICCLHIRPSLLIFPGFLSSRSAVNACGGRRQVSTRIRATDLSDSGMNSLLSLLEKRELMLAPCGVNFLSKC